MIEAPLRITLFVRRKVVSHNSSQGPLEEIVNRFDTMYLFFYKIYLLKLNCLFVSQYTGLLVILSVCLSVCLHAAFDELLRFHGYFCTKRLRNRSRVFWVAWGSAFRKRSDPDSHLKKDLDQDPV